jgi:hypothetical protein
MMTATFTPSPRSTLPPSVLPDISRTRGEMSGRTEGATEHDHRFEACEEARS